MRRLLFAICLYPVALSAQDDAASSAPMEPLSSPYLVKLTGGLLLVVIVIFVLAWLVRKFNLNQQSQNGLIRIIAGLSVGTRDRIVLLQVGDEQILLGLTPGRIEKLHTLDKPLADESVAPAAASFAGKLNRLMREPEEKT